MGKGKESKQKTRDDYYGGYAMNILVVGSGFDLEHDLKTQYSDFLVFLQKYKNDSC